MSWKAEERTSHEKGDRGKRSGTDKSEKEGKLVRVHFEGKWSLNYDSRRNYGREKRGKINKYDGHF